ncbi:MULTISPECIES: Vps62-related protein [unclassified Pseudomonas]|uniref:Vps62-related protein n=1 Tax=unclassified Pseudomonas TaxID=196821 RepID=UPI0028937592|nr:MULTISPECIES: Vps62-related protein [unclassified Pseudomonas]
MTTHETTALPTGQMQPIRNDNLLISFTTEFLRIWDTTGSRAKPAAFWRPTPPADVLPGYFPLGDVAVTDSENITGRHVVAVVCEAATPSADPAKGSALRRPDDYELIWRDTGTGSKKDGAIWRPIPPQGYVALGSVCSDGHGKPSLNAVRCVRDDLLIASGLSESVWTDKGSRGRQSISAWSAVPPSPPLDEIHLAPGTFVGFEGYNRPANFPVYSLRIPILLEANTRPAAPVLDSEIPPVLQTPEHPTYTARLPWFTVKDPELSPPQQHSRSPEYLLQRTDHYQLVGHCHNEGNNKTVRWTAPRMQKNDSLRLFTYATSIGFGTQWQSNLHRPFLFSARLNNDFTQCETQSNEWLNPAPIEVAAIVAKNSSIAVYLTQSTYRLLRADGTQVANDVCYTDSKNLHFSVYTPPQPNATVAPAEAAPLQSTTVDHAADNAVPALPASTELPVPTDSAP